MKVPISKVCFDAAEQEQVTKVLQSGWVVQGPMVAEFERRFAQFIGAPEAVAMSSCTTALHAAVAALGLKPGDEVIVPGFTWVATPNAVEYQHATVRFADISLATFNLEPAQVESLITPRTVGIIPVHLFGLCADMDPLRSLAGKHRLWLLEDAACAFGSTYGNEPAGLMGQLGCFSFHPRKSLTTGEGGMVVTRSPELAAQCRALRNHGAVADNRQRHQSSTGFLLPEFPLLGYNYRMTDIQGAVGVAQMGKAQWLLDERRRCAKSYDQLLADVSWLRRPAAPEGYGHTYQSYVCLFAPEAPSLSGMNRLGEARNALLLALEQKGVTTRQGTHAPVALQYYREKYRLRPEDHANCWLADRLSIALPLYPGLTETEMNYVVDQVRTCGSAVLNQLT